MRIMLPLLLITLFGKSAYCQSLKDKSEITFLNWIISSNRMQYIYPSTDVSISDVKNLSLQIFTADGRPVVGKTFDQFLTPDEIQLFKSKIKVIKKHRWQLLYPSLKVSHYIKKDEHLHGGTTTYFGLSEPIFLNPDHSRVIIAVSFEADVAFGSGDLWLCEYENGQWQVIAKGNLWNS